MSKYTKLDIEKLYEKDRIYGCVFDGSIRCYDDCPLCDSTYDCRVLDWLERLPIIDIVECEECKYAEKCEQIIVFDSTENQIEGRKIKFCSHGERINK